jgi:hypothetical protein
MPFLDPASRLEDILGAILDIEAFTSSKSFEDYMAEPMMRRAAERSVEIISEASRHVPDDLKARHPGVLRVPAGLGFVRFRHRSGSSGSARRFPRPTRGSMSDGNSTPFPPMWLLRSAAGLTSADLPVGALANAKGLRNQLW